MSFLSDHRFLEVAALTREIRDVVIPDTEVWEIQGFMGQAAYDPNIQVCLVWDRGGAGEKLIISTHGDLNTKVNRQVTGDGVKKLAIVLDNLTNSASAIGARWTGKKISGPAGLGTPTNSNVARVRVDKVIEDNVAASSTAIDELGTPIPDGETWRVLEFGGSEMGAGDNVASSIALQVADDGTTWKTVRGFGVVSACCHNAIDRDFVGDGTRKLRVIRQNNTASAKKIVAWIIGVKIP